MLWFPVADVCVDLLDDLGDALTRGAGELDGHVAFDPERVRLGLVNSADPAVADPDLRVRSCASRTGVTPRISST